MKPFVLLASRAQDAAADAEYAAMLSYGGLRPHELRRVRLEAEPMPDLDLDALSGVLVGGSPFDASTPADEKSAVQVRVEKEMAALLDELVERDAPFLGACYGVGTLGVHQGGVIDRVHAEPISAVRVTLTPQGRADPLLADVPDAFDAFVGHKEACRVLPPTATLLASSPTCPVQMFRVRRHLYATQFHPELDVDGISTRIRVYREYGYFPPAEADAVLARVRHADVWAPPRILAAFVRRYARD
ncbi:glutamine amidotransferase [Cellulomonas fimi]|uniref:Glutamine amidotransferase n=1 Tax=Cellulomonas fimi (strain ATCC 484 / DSM 20113 / JCM 1341 / CCUG 24087 / LMG 16345 / NBRC 15513 / NCIMB 8980 / NCTC 7547 / NRS-133) TaxID=590998 RepID=F4H6P6_CELFA|nr:glutamine amidotransferase [Cellulomonas fimi]AEE46807.1 glutamine amidotransferase [Cellulomonas fimi ATCC 484]NNH06350.1 glutamine amidotransferase [Cellulomonas fimi]VEH34244.1 GMP synthase [glutamine-hydrolyzing] [Cellulomonas fimi]